MDGVLVTISPQLESSHSMPAGDSPSPSPRIAEMRALVGMPPGARVAVAMSGGVDSSVTAALLVEAGYEVVGLTARLYDEPQGAVARAGSCCAPRDARDARGVAAALGIRHFVVDEREAFAETVVARFVADWQQARTPNPCVECNRHLKFERLLQRARMLGCDIMATGHYARLERDADGRPALRRAVDASKDQAYFLWPLSAASAPWIRFPLGGLTKVEVRAEGVRLGVPVAEKPESMDICFTGGARPADWLAQHGGAPAGALVSMQGLRLGQHESLAQFTIGQRRGAALAQVGGAALYVIDKRADGTVTLGERDDLAVRTITALEASTIDGETLRVGSQFDAQVRHRGQALPVEVIAADASAWTLRFLAHAEAIAPGQSVVLWDGDRMIGGGIIEATERATAATRAP